VFFFFFFERKVHFRRELFPLTIKTACLRTKKSAEALKITRHKVDPIECQFAQVLLLFVCHTEEGADRKNCIVFANCKW